MKVRLLNKVENNVAKEEIACFEQFHKSSAAEVSESVYIRGLIWA